MIRLLAYALALSLLANVFLALGWQTARVTIKANESKAAIALANAQKAAREAERKHAQEMAAIGERHEQDKRDAQKDQDLLVDGLRAGVVRLQKRWAGCLSDLGATAAERDAAARDREESAARIVRAARDADDQIKRLQDVVRRDRSTDAPTGDK